MTSQPRTWRKSSHSAQGGDCIEVAPLDRRTGVRDSKSRAEGHIELPTTAWSAFLGSLKRH
ncbi:DUF397 domain-containing protein [Yinghuangia sp. ASG 101]|uniref:DUF397 domain-containing protein n=1 Tax=Yinghuangia sp. ASG 101 TaxID=2896848 RepID=UPI001E32BDC0|nr:DUF397 domain-containing protein [Yinghuangia sp. ASG 101]UGQ14717.1 DUF397 domain-containing protein [Yinghuangia sp. ASG 101]